MRVPSFDLFPAEEGDEEKVENVLEYFLSRKRTPFQEWFYWSLLGPAREWPKEDPVPHEEGTGG